MRIGTVTAQYIYRDRPGVAQPKELLDPTQLVGAENKWFGSSNNSWINIKLADKITVDGIGFISSEHTGDPAW